MVYPLRETVVSIGRGPDNTIQIIDTRISRNHCLLMVNGGRWFVRDLLSKNGTQVNERLIHTDHPLERGDRLQVGDTIFLFEREAQPRDEQSKTTGVRLTEEEIYVEASQVLRLREEIGDEREISGQFMVLASDRDQLNALYQAADMISSIFDLDELLERVLDLVQQYLAPDRVSIMLYDDQFQILVPRVLRRREQAHEELVISNSIINRAITEHVALLVGDAPRDFRFRASESIIYQKIQSAICAPIIHKQDVLGVLYLDRRRPIGQYGENDLRLVGGIANLAAMAIMNTRLHKQLLARHAEEREMEIARTIQENLLPSVMPALPGFEVAGMTRPAKMVGGDYFDVIPLPDGRCVLAIADVSGKGVPAAILLAGVRAAVQIEVRDMKDDCLTKVVERLNQMVCRDATDNMFVTMILGVLDPAARSFTYVNAGHVHPMLCHPDGHLQMLEAGGCFLGLIPNGAYQSETLELPHASMLLMYSDGVIDLMNSKSDMFGLQRLADFLSGNPGLGAEDFCRKLDEVTFHFRESAEPFDDFTALALRCSGE